MDVYVTLRFHHGGKLQLKPRIKYEGGIVIDYFDVDDDKLSYFEFVDIAKEIGAFASVGEDLNRTSVSVGEHLRASTKSQSSTKRGRGRLRSSTKQLELEGIERETEIGNGIRTTVAFDGSGPTRRGRGTRADLVGRERETATSVSKRGIGRGTVVAATAIITDVDGATGGGKRPRIVGIAILHIQNNFKIHNPEMPMNSSIVTGHLRHHNQDHA
uniref:PB1-like domain-containing protein n=1 Tax=Solanum lycopersicum TaxID=4081 RepID=A0A3Q7G595_SOLLC